VKKASLYIATAMAALAAVGTMEGLGGCKSPTTQALTPAQVATQVCPSAQGVIASLQAMSGLPEGATKDLAAAAPIVDAVCSASATVTTVNLQSLAKDAAPMIIAIIKASPLSVDEQNKAILDVTAFQLLINAVLAAQTGGAATTTPAVVAPAVVAPAVVAPAVAPTK